MANTVGGWEDVLPGCVGFVGRLACMWGAGFGEFLVVSFCVT